MREGQKVEQKMHNELELAYLIHLNKQFNEFRAKCRVAQTPHAAKMDTVVYCFQMLLDGEDTFDRFFWVCMDAVPQSAHREMVRLYGDHVECRDSGGLHEMCVTRVCMIRCAFLLLYADAVEPLPPLRISAHPFEGACIEIANDAKYGLLVEPDGDLLPWDARDFEWINIGGPIERDDILWYMLSRNIDFNLISSLAWSFLTMQERIILELQGREIR